jgi:hypothetical protein
MPQLHLKMIYEDPSQNLCGYIHCHNNTTLFDEVGVYDTNQDRNSDSNDSDEYGEEDVESIFFERYEDDNNLVI